MRWEAVALRLSTTLAGVDPSAPSPTHSHSHRQHTHTCHVCRCGAVLSMSLGLLASTQSPCRAAQQQPLPAPSSSNKSPVAACAVRKQECCCQPWPKSSATQSLTGCSLSRAAWATLQVRLRVHTSTTRCRLLLGGGASTCVLTHNPLSSPTVLHMSPHHRALGHPSGAPPRPLPAAQCNHLPGERELCRRREAVKDAVVVHCGLTSHVYSFF